MHVVIVPVPAGKGEPGPRARRPRYVFATDRPDAVVPESPSARLRWLSLAEAHGLVGAGQRAGDAGSAPRPSWPEPPPEVEG